MAGGGGSSTQQGGGIESPNSLISDSLLRILDVLCEGPISGFAYQGGSYGNDPLTSTFFNDVRFRNLDGSYNFNVSGQGFQFAWTLGTTGQQAISGFEHISCNVPLPPDTRLSNPPPNAGLPKTLLVTFNTQQYPDANSIVVNYRIPALYVANVSNGNINGFEVDASIDCSLNGGPFQNLSAGINQFVGKCTTPYFRTYQYLLPTTNPPQSFYQWTLRFQKTNQDVLSTSVANDIFVDSVAVIGGSQYNYPNTSLVGLYIDALQFGTVPSRSYLIQGILMSVPSGYTPTRYTPGLTIIRNCFIQSGDGNINFNYTLLPNSGMVENGIYTGMLVTGSGISPNSHLTFMNPLPDTPYFQLNNGENQTITTNEDLYFIDPNYPTQTAIPAVYPDVWDGTFVTGVWTDNPAWIFYDFVTNPRYGLGQYINTNNIDIWTLYQLSQYCDQMVDNGQGIGVSEPQFAINAFIKDAEDAYSMLLNLASAFRGMLYYANGTIRASLTDNKTPVFNYTNANVINGVFNYSSTARSARHNAIQVKYTDPNNLYRDNYIKIEDPIGITQYGYNEKQIDAFGCTSIGQATRVGNWILTTERLRTETVSFQVGLDGLYIRPGDVFNLYDNFRMNRNQGGRIISFDSSQQFITLDRQVNLDSGCIYALTCLVPTFNFDTNTDITGSNQIPQIRNPQIQSRTVLNANLSGLSTLQVEDAFSGLSQNSVWILSATGVYTSGYIPTVFEQAPQYECLAINQSSPGIFDILALNYNTGINYIVNTGFTTIMNPINSGNSAVPLPPTNFTGNLVTGTLSDSSYYQYLNLTWSPSLSSNVVSYAVSGDVGGTYRQLGTTTSTGFQYISPVAGAFVDFKVCAISNGGIYSAAQFTNAFFPAVEGLDGNQIRFWLLPDGFGPLDQIAIFYNRPHQSTTSTNIYYCTGIGTPFTQVLNQSFYPVLGVSLSGMSSTGTTAWFQEDSFDTAATLLSQGSISQANNTLLFLVDNELMSIGKITGLSNNEYSFSVSRGVLGTAPFAHNANVSGWIFFQSQMDAFTDASILNIFTGHIAPYQGINGYDTGIATKYFQIQNNTATSQGTIVPSLPGLSYTIPNPAPPPPIGLTGYPVVVSTGSLGYNYQWFLSWTPPITTDVISGYNVYRTRAAIIESDPGSFLGSTSIPSFSALSTAAGALHNFNEVWVTTVSVDGFESITGNQFP